MIGKKKRKTGFLFFIFIVVFLADLLFPVFRTFPLSVIFEDQGFANSTLKAVSELPYRERKKLLYSHYPSIHESLLLATIGDLALSPGERKLLRLTADKYPLDEIDDKQAQWLIELMSVPQFEAFFQESIPLQYCSDIPIIKEMFTPVQIKVFKEYQKKVPILMYHQVHDTNFWITPATFKNHLEAMYRAGYCLISLTDYLKGDFSTVPDGRKPILITFDDAFESQFFMDNTGKPSTNCAVGIMEAFAKDHPDFNCTATFFPYLSIIPFGQVQQETLWIRKFQYLWERGYDIGCHSYYHTFFEKISEKAVKEELDFFYNHLSYYFPEDYKKAFIIAYPYGSLPKNRQFMQAYEYKGNKLNGGLSAWGGLAPLVHHGDYFYLPRIQADADTLVDIDTWDSFIIESKTYTMCQFYRDFPELVNLWVRKNDPDSKGLYFYQNKVLD